MTIRRMVSLEPRASLLTITDRDITLVLVDRDILTLKVRDLDFTLDDRETLTLDYRETLTLDYRDGLGMMDAILLQNNTGYWLWQNGSIMLWNYRPANYLTVSSRTVSLTTARL